MRSRSTFLVAVLTGLMLTPFVAVAAPTRRHDPRYDVSPASLAASTRCPSRSTHARTVLLVHGTGSTAQESWSHSYAKLLPAQGFDVCTVTMPGRTLGDAQVSAEYVAYAIHAATRAFHRRTTVIGHS